MISFKLKLKLFKFENLILNLKKNHVTYLFRSLGTELDKVLF